MNDSEIQSLQIVAVLLLVFGGLLGGIVGTVMLCIGILLMLFSCYKVKPPPAVRDDEEEIPLRDMEF
jgi:hypothetical protein